MGDYQGQRLLSGGTPAVDCLPQGSSPGTFFMVIWHQVKTFVFSLTFQIYDLKILSVDPLLLLCLFLLIPSTGFLSLSAKLFYVAIAVNTGTMLKIQS